MRSRRTLLGAGTVAVAAAVLLAFRGCPEETADAPPAKEEAARGAGDAPSPQIRPAARAHAPAVEVPTEEPAPAAVPDDATPSQPFLDVLVVSDADGAPVEGALVSCERSDRGTFPVPTDEKGRARVVWDREGLVVVCVGHPPGRRDLADHRRWIAAMPGSVTVRLPPISVLRGRVLAAGNVPRQVSVSYAASEDPPTDHPVADLPLAEDGTFSVEVAPGRYDVWTGPTGPEGTRWHEERRNGVDPAAGPVEIDLRAADGFSCMLRAEGIAEQGLLGAAYPSPTGGAFRFLDTAEGPAFGRPIRTMRVQADVPHDVWAKVVRETHGPAVGWGVARGVLPGSRVEIVVRPAWTLRISLADPAGAPVRQMLHCLAWAEGAPARPVVSFGDVAAAGTSCDGEATLTGLPPLPATIVVGEPGETWCSVDSPRVEPGTESVVVTVERTHTLHGTLHDDEGRPVDADIVAHIQWPAPAMELRSDSSRSSPGRFELRGVPRGPVKLRWEIRGLPGGDLGEFVVPAPGPLRLTVRAPR